MTYNMSYQVKALANPFTPEHLMMNKIYLVSTIICYLLIAGSFRYKKHSGNLLFMAFVLAIPRQGIRMLDIERTEGDHISEEDFEQLIG
jgi:hypothetical protein